MTQGSKSSLAEDQSPAWVVRKDSLLHILLIEEYLAMK